MLLLKRLETRSVHRFCLTIGRHQFSTYFMGPYSAFCLLQNNSVLKSWRSSDIPPFLSISAAHSLSCSVYRLLKDAVIYTPISTSEMVGQ